MAVVSPPSNWPRNRLLLALPTRNLKQLLPELEHIRCQREQILLDVDSSLDSIFFVDSGVVSVMAVYSDGRRHHRDGNDRQGRLHGNSGRFRCQEFFRSFLRPNPWKRREDVAFGFQSGHGVDAVLPKSHVWLRPRLS